MPVDLEAFKGPTFVAINRELAEQTAATISKVFPMKTEDGKLEVRATNVKVDHEKFDPYDLNAWQNAREQGKTLAVPITADLALFRDGKRVQSRSNAKVGELPLMGSTGTFMVGGNDFFTPFAQFRLKPGIYSRQKANGEYESFMPMQGASMTVWMDPAKGRFKLSHGSTNVDLYPVLKALGKTDEEIVQAWGGDQRARELLAQNKVDKGEKDIDKLFESVFHLKQNRDLLKGGVIKLDEQLTGVSNAGKISALKTWMDSKWLDPYVTKKTVGQAIDKPDDAAFLAASRKILDVQRGDVDPDDRDAPHFKTSQGIADLLNERLERQAWRVQKKLFQRLRKGDNVTLGEAMGPNFLDPLTSGYFGGAGGIEGGMAHTAEGANPLALASEQSKTTFMGPGGIVDMHAVSKESRLFRPGAMGFVDPVHTPEGCFGPYSEVYTSKGWVRWDTVTADMELACMVDGKLEYHRPIRTIAKRYEGPMVGYKSDRIEFFVTPNHRMWVRPQDRGAKYRIVEAGKLPGTNRNVMAGGHAPLPGNGATFTLPPVAAKGAGMQKRGAPPIGAHMNPSAPPIGIVDWCRFLGWYLSEGNVSSVASRSYSTTITQLHSSKAECAHIAATLDRLPFTWSTAGDRRFHISGKQLNAYLAPLGKSRTKRVPPEVFSAPPEARMAFLEAALMGDGRKRTKGSGERGDNPLSKWICYCTTSKQLADDVYRLMFELGLSASISFEPDERKPIYLGCYCVHIHSFSERQLTSKNHRHPEGLYYTADYAGMIYCATVPGGLMFCRHGAGMGFWIGNSGVGLNVHAAATARKVGKTMVAQFVPVVNGRVKWDQRVGLTVEEANDTTIGYPEFWDTKSGAPVDPYTGEMNPAVVRANRDNEILEVPPSEVKYILPNGLAAFDFVGNAAGFFANTHPNRGMMAGKHITQALPLVHRELPLVTLKTSAGKDVMLSLGQGSTVSARNAGTVTKVTEDGIWVDGTKHAIFDRYPMQAKVAIDHIPVVKVGDVVKKGDLLADSNYTKDGRLALGVNLRSAYIPWKNASNYEDAIVISEGAAKKLTSDHTHRHELVLDEGTKVDPKLFIAQFPASLTREMVGKLGEDGVVREGQDVKPGDVLIAAVRARKYDEFDRTAKNLSSIHKMLERPWLDASVRWDEDFVGHVNRIVRTKDKIEVHIQTAEPMRVADKLSMGSAAKGTIAEITPDHEMPTDEKGRPVEVIFNPHGVAGRINPSQTIEQAVGKLVRDHGVTVDHVNFGDNKVADRIQGLLDEHKVKHEERLFDPIEGRHIENPVPVGYNYVYKLDHPVRKKFSARTRDGYTMDEAPTAGRGKGGQSFDGLQTYALLGHNAHAILGESMGVRGTKNDDYWVAYQAGEKPPAPKVPFVFEKMRAMMAASGIDSQQHGNALHFMPMTDANTLKRSNGEIQKASLVRAKDLAEEKGGLFDVATTGGLKGDKWAHIDLGRKVPHPLYEKVIKDLLDLKTADYLGLIGQTRHYNAETGEFSDQPGSNTTTGEAAFRELLDFDPVDRYKEVQKKARTASGSDLNRLNRAARYLKGLQDVRQTPFDSYMVSKVPVIPPMYRPVIEQRNGGLRVADANLLYRDMLLTRDTLQKGEQEGSLPSQDLAKARVSLYDSFGAMVGVGKSLTHRRDADLRGFVDVIKGKNNKEGLFQQQLSRRRNDYTGRSTIESDATLGPDEAAIPEDMAWKIYQPAIVRRLAQLGWKPADALREVERKGLVARNALDEELRTRPILLNRAPSLHRWSVLAAMPKIHSGKEVRISPFVLGPFNADMDGDANVGVVLLSHPATVAVKGSPMAARFRSSLPLVTKGHVVSFVDLADVPHGAVRALTEGKHGKVAFFDAAPDLEVLVYDAKSAKVRWAPVDGWSEHYGLEIEIAELSSGYQIVTDDDPRAVYGLDLDTLEERRGTPTEAVGKILVPRVVRVPHLGETLRVVAVPEDAQARPRNDRGIRPTRFLPAELELTRSLGYALGVFIGDGWDSGSSADKPTQVHVCGNDPDVRQAFHSALQEILPGITPGAATFSKRRDDDPGKVLRDSHTLGRHGTVTRDTYCSAALARLFKLWCGHGARNKQLPPWYLAAPEEFRRGLLGGLMDTDGSLTTSRAKAKPQVIASYTSISFRLVREVRLLAQSLGIRSRITPSKYKKQGAAVRTERAWQIGFSTVDIVQWGGVDMMCERKKAKIRSVTCDPDSGAAAKSDLVPLPPTLAAALSVGLNKVDASAYVICRKQEGYCSRSVANRLIEIYGKAKIRAIELGPKWLAIVADTNVTWDRVESVQKTGIRETGYDLTVPGYETFMNTDGVILSNTMSVFAPLSDRGKREAHDLLPSRNLWYDKDRSLAFAVDKDVITGLFALTRRGINSGKTYPTRQAALDAYKNNKDGLRMDSLVMIEDEKNQNLQAIGWMIFENIVPVRFLGGISPPIDGKKLSTILDRIAKDSPADFNNLGRKLQSAGFAFAARAGGIGGTVQELAIDRTKINALLGQIDRAVKQGKTPDEKRKLALEMFAKVKPDIDKEISDHLDTIGLGGSVFLAAKPSSKLGMDSYRQMVASPVMVTDARDRAIPSVIKSSYGGGMLLSDYIMATPGARSGMVDKGLSVAGPGFLTKELAGNLGPVRVEVKDCGTQEGIQVPVDPPEGVKQHDADLLDRHLLHDIPGTSFKRNDVVTPGMLARLRDAKIANVMVRSPMTCEADAPPCQMCAGRTPNGQLHPIGANIGYNYGMTIGERSTQLTLKKFHSGGTVGAGSNLADGFARLRELLSVPETVKGQGTLADVTGSVTSIKAAPQGGHYIQILPEGQSSLRGDHIEHYVLPGRNIAVVQGEKVEKGDRLSDGSYRPQEIAEKKGLLAAQSYVVDEMRKAFQSAGAVVRKPVLEVAVAAMMRFMRITNDGGEKDLMTGQILSEQEFKKRQLKNPVIQGVPELPGLSHVPLVRSNDMLERLNFQRLEDTLREIPAQGGVSDLSGAKSPIPGFAYGAAFRPGQASYEMTKDKIPMGDSAFNRLAHFG